MHVLFAFCFFFFKAREGKFRKMLLQFELNLIVIGLWSQHIYNNYWTSAKTEKSVRAWNDETDEWVGRETFLRKADLASKVHLCQCMKGTRKKHQISIIAEAWNRSTREGKTGDVILSKTAITLWEHQLSIWVDLGAVDQLENYNELSKQSGVVWQNGLNTVGAIQNIKYIDL